MKPMTLAEWVHIKDWVDKFQQEFGRLPASGQLQGFACLIDWPDPRGANGESADDDDDEPDED
jgi:hypothetical protein